MISKSFRRNALVLATLLTLAACVGATKNWRWRQDENIIKDYLLKNTPIGSSEQKVISYLEANDMDYNSPWRGEVEAGTGHPPNGIPGSSFISAVAGEYGLIFVTSVETFYIFDLNRSLVEIAIRKTTDAL